MNLSEVRKRFLDFYTARGHVAIPSAPIVPGNDPTTLFTSSGMQPLIPYLLGEEHPEGTRLTDAQLSFRAGDIEEVGDNRHTTFFEMMGNWSLGDYFKKEQLPWIFEFLTSKEEGLGLDPAKLYVTVFAGDEEAGMSPDMEAAEIWKGLFESKGVAAEFSNIGSEEAGYEKGMHGNDRIFAYDAKKNWWSRAGVPSNMPAGEPGGPDSEVFYDFGLPHDTKWGKNCHPNCDCGRFVEIANSVFMQYKKEEDGSFSTLPKLNVDFGGGLERLGMAAIGSPDAFALDVFAPAKSILEDCSGKTYGEEDASTRSFRIIMDHMRAAAFILAEGIRPANTEAGYVLRRLIRRSIREADKLGVKDAILADVIEGFASYYGDQYPHVKENAEFIREEIRKEEEKFRKTLTQGMREFEKATSIMGVHVEDVKEINGVPISQIKEYKGVPIESLRTISGDQAFTLSTSYGFPVELTEELAQERGLSLDREAFDRKMKEHQDKSRAGAAQKFAGGLADHQEQTVKYHTTHHLLLAALQKVLGPDVKQRGSNITAERLRIDFSFDRKVSPEEIADVERLVNEKIKEELTVIKTVMPRTEAEALGAQAEFGVKYGDIVNVYSIGPKDATEADPKIADAFSKEFCGGPHVGNTRELAEGGKSFKVLKEEAVSAGVRRIKAVLA